MRQFWKETMAVSIRLLNRAKMMPENKKENEIWTSFASFYRFVIREIPNQVDLP